MLPESLHNRNTTVVYADKIIRSIRFFELLKDTPKTKCLEVNIALAESNFSGVLITENGKLVSYNHQRLLSILINNMKRNLLTTRSRNELSKSSLGPSHQEAEYDSLISELKVLENINWPTSKPIGYGELEISKFCARFKLNENKINNSFRDYLENSSVVPKDLCSLLNYSKLISCNVSKALAK